MRNSGCYAYTDEKKQLIAINHYEMQFRKCRISHDKQYRRNHYKSCTCCEDLNGNGMSGLGHSACQQQIKSKANGCAHRKSRC